MTLLSCRKAEGHDADGARDMTLVVEGACRERHTEQSKEHSIEHSNASAGKTATKTKTKTAPETHAPSPVKKPRALNVAAAAQADSVYASYPRKVGRGRAIPAIRKALKNTPFDQLLRAVQAFAAEVARKLGTPDARFIPYPATWFNGERWLDEPSASAPAVEVDHLPLMTFPGDAK